VRLPGEKTFTSRILSPTMSIPTRNMPSAISLGRIISATLSSVSPISTASALPPAWMLLRMSSFAATRRSAAYLPPIFKRPAVHQEQADVALLGRRDIGLGDDVAVAADRLDHLVEVGAAFFGSSLNTPDRPSPGAASG
jgi:hypothetical protein